MTVRDYNNDMILGQKWAVMVKTTLVHDNIEPFEEFCVETYHYSVPLLDRCPYFNDNVSYFHVVNDEIVLVVNRTDFV